MRKIVLILFFCLIFHGCAESLPPELNNLNPCIITVSDSGQPVSGIQVSLININKQASGAWGNVAVTNNNGIARIQTTFCSITKNGVKEGTYIVVFNKSVSLPPELQFTEEEMTLSETERQRKQEKREKFLKRNRIIPVKLESELSSPVQITVENNRTAKLNIELTKY
jgi:5-hydroxyisourate hydrolase-like protein (transthyretin family)